MDMENKINVLVTGASGQVGQSIKEVYDRLKNELNPMIEGFNYIFADHKTVDICNHENLENFVKDNNINVIVNCAAWTDVDGAEIPENFEKVIEINGTKGIKNLVEVTNKYNAKLIHVSTDYVFGRVGSIGDEYEVPSPVNTYGQTKRMGEIHIQTYCNNYQIIRTSSVYSKYGKNFVKTMFKLLTDTKSEKEISVINDQVFYATSGERIAAFIIEYLCNTYFNKSAVISPQNTVFHITDNYAANYNWYSFAVMIKSAIDKKNIVTKDINPISTEEYVKKQNKIIAQRPYRSYLYSFETMKMEQQMRWGHIKKEKDEYGRTLYSTEEEVQKVIDYLMNNQEA